jgi:hypothetical protein
MDSLHLDVYPLLMEGVIGGSERFKGLFMSLHASLHYEVFI